MEEQEVPWSDLPEEILLVIGKRLETRIDVLRFRSVCGAWRSSIPPSHKDAPSFPRRIQNPFPAVPHITSFLTQNTVFRLEPLHYNAQNYPSSSFQKQCLIKVEESEPGHFRLLNPLSNHLLRYPLDTFPKVIDLMDFRVVELTKGYSLRHAGGPNMSYIDKVAVFPNSAWSSVEECLLFAIYQAGKLGFMKLGDEYWKPVDVQNSYYDDVIVHKGQFYVVDKWGTISWIDTSSLKLVQFSPPLCGFGTKKCLVESCGSLYVVDMFFDREIEGRERGRRLMLFREVVDIKIYRLDEEWGTWVDVKNLGDRVFVLGKDCNFSVSAQEFAGCEGNCVYFVDQFDTRVFSLNKAKFGTLAYFPTSSKVIWTSSTWLDAV